MSSVSNDAVNDNGVDDAIRRRKLAFRSAHRGMKEMDLLLTRFTDTELATMAAEELSLFEAMLNIPDQDFYAVLLGNAPVPEEHDNAVMARLIQSARNP